MSRRPDHLATNLQTALWKLRIEPRTKLSFLLLVLLAAIAARGSAEKPLIERAAPDPARQARSAAWLDHFGSQTPALLQTVAELDRERANWNGSAATTRCRRARRALSEVDRNGLLEVTDYTLVSAIGDALDDLDRAVWACSERRYFELDYRLGLAQRRLARARELARAQSRR